MSTVLSVALGLCFVVSNAPAQQLNPQQRAQGIAASFNKTKHKIKEKRGFREESFTEVRNQPVVRQDVRDYSGTYVAIGLGCAINIEVNSNGRVVGNGSEPGAEKIRKFTLKDAKIEGALLLGTKVYEDGTLEKFEGAFINRTQRNSPTDNGVATFGLGVLYDPPKVENDYGFTLTKLFYELKK